MRPHGQGESDMDLKRIESLLKLLKDEDIAEFEYSEKTESDGYSVRVNRVSSYAPVQVAASPPVNDGSYQGAASATGVGSVAVEMEDDGHEVAAPMVGTFYRASSPDADPYVQLGDRVKEGETLCIIEAMKLMNEIEADVAGTISAILVDNAKPVQFGQALFKIRED